MTAHSEDGSSALEDFLSAPPFDPESIGDPPLKDGEGSQLTRERINLNTD